MVETVQTEVGIVKTSVGDGLGGKVEALKEQLDANVTSLAEEIDISTAKLTHSKHWQKPLMLPLKHVFQALNKCWVSCWPL